MRDGGKQATQARPVLLMKNDKPTQLDKFKEAARHLETDDDESRFEESHMTIAQIRLWLYPLAKYLGDLQAITSPRRGAIQRRITRRIAGKVTGRTVMRCVGNLFR